MQTPGIASALCGQKLSHIVYLRFVRDLASTTWLQAAVHHRVPGIRHSAICVIPGFRQVRISVIVPIVPEIRYAHFPGSSRPSRPVPEIRYPLCEGCGLRDQMALCLDFSAVM